MRLTDKTAQLKEFKIKQVIAETGTAAPQATVMAITKFEITLSRAEVSILKDDHACGFDEEAAKFMLLMMDAFGEDGAKSTLKPAPRRGKKKEAKKENEKAKLAEVKISKAFKPLVIRGESVFGTFRIVGKHYRDAKIKPLDEGVRFTFQLESHINRATIADLGVSLGPIKITTDLSQPGLNLQDAA